MASGERASGISISISSPYYHADFSACFIAGTMVQAESGTVAIEEIQVGDYVWAWDEETGDVALKQVVETYVNETDELIHVFAGGEEIVTPPSHPFYSPVKGWTDAAKLRAGDILVLANGEYVVVEKIQHEILEAPIAVYNFQVEDYHTYYVSNAGVLVHNRCSNTSTKLTNREARKAAGELGYSEVNERSYNQLVFKNAKANSDVRFITPDIDSHSGGVWKGASTIGGLFSKNTRSGTYDALLRRIGP